MWLLESDGGALGGSRVWLRPGKLYLFGRTQAEAGQFAISHKTISRRHMTIQVGDVASGDSQDLSQRSQLTIEDLSTKTGTTVNDYKFKGEKHVLSEPTATIKLGTCAEAFRISWHSVVLTFSFTNRELQSDPFRALRDRLEQFDIKFFPGYQTRHTTHVVARKRNTAKGLQALIDGKYIVTDAFVDALEAAASPEEGSEATDLSPLERDFDNNWPDPMKYLPPRGGEPVERPVSAYAPDDSRREIFDGYTFIFYDNSQFETLLAPITHGKGKALYTEVVAGQKSVDDFVLFVKTEAGEKGLGSFEDGSEGRGVVVVRYSPSKGGDIEWYANFFTQVSLRLDHRPIEQNEFLEAILIKDASILRRPLEVAPSQDSPPSAAAARRNTATSTNEMEVDPPAPSQQTSQPPPTAAQPPRRGRGRRAPTKRFAGFDDSSDEDIKESITPDIPDSAPPPDSEEALFVSQEVEPITIDEPESAPTTRSTRAQRKRPLSQEDMLDELVPTAAAAKRRRIEASEEPVPRRAASAAVEDEPPTKETKPTKKIKQEIDVLEQARKRREELEAAAKAEREDLAKLPEDLDFAEIRRNAVIVEMPLRQKPSAPRTHEQNVADGRWDPRWNGRKNFKGFRQRGTPAGRAPLKTIVALVEAKKKDFGIGDDYWLENDSRKTREDDTQESAVQESTAQTQPKTRQTQRVVLSDDSADDAVVEETPEIAVAPAASASARTRGTRTASQTQSSIGKATSSSRSQSVRQPSQSKRAAATPADREPPAKKTRGMRKVFEVQDSDESEDELQFRFGRRKK